MPSRAASGHLQEALVGLVIVGFFASPGVIDQWRLPPRADDPELVGRVAARLVPPSDAPYNLSKPDQLDWGQVHQVRFIQAVTNNKTGGFFVETGAYDGEIMSNTLLLERVFGWRGLLIEPSRTLFPRLVAKHRRAWALHACCSQTGAPFQAVFRDQVQYGVSSVEDGLSAEALSNNIKRTFHPDTDITRYPVECVPLYTALRAINRTSVDFFSLDVEGVEMGVLAYMPWDKVDIKIVLVEFHMAHFWNPQTDQIRWFMEQQGYLAIHLTHDWLFVKKSSEFADGALDTVRRLRQELADAEHPPGDMRGRVYNPYND